KADLSDPVMGFNVDGSSARAITLGAVGAQRWQAAISGKASHAGVYPERGISATVVASLALADIHRQGWFGKIKKGRKEGTSNVAGVGDEDGKSAGVATNVVTDFALARGEARSPDAAFARTIPAAYRHAFQRAAREVTDYRGKPARVKFESRQDYF